MAQILKNMMIEHLDDQEIESNGLATDHPRN